MATVAQNFSVDKIAAMKYTGGAAWGVGVNCSASNAGINPYYPGGMKMLQLENKVFPTLGTLMKAYHAQGRYGDTAQEWQMLMDHTVCGLPLACFFGQDNSPAVVDTTGYIHTLALQTRSAHYLTYAMYEGTGLLTWELPSVAVMGFTAEFAPGNVPLMFGFRGVASHCLQTGNADVIGGATSTLNRPYSTAALGSATARTLDAWGDYSNLVFRMNTQSGGGLSSAEEFNAATVKVNMDRVFEADHATKNSADGTLFARGPRQPRQTGPVTGTLEVSFPNLDTVDDDFVDVIMDIIASGTGAEYKADLTCNAPVLAGAATAYYGHNFEMPRLYLVSATPEADVLEGGKPVTLMFEMGTASSAPTGMTVTNPTWKVTNALSTSFLA